MNKIISLLKPTGKWGAVAAVVAGAMVGLFFYTAYVSNAVSYLSDDPETCVNCHIMAPEFATWSHSSHRQVAHCNDCHVPHNHILNKYYFKAKDGMRHAYMFTMRLEPQTIFIKEESKMVVQQNCLRCHEKLVHNPRMLYYTAAFKQHFSDRKCWECHRETPHGTVHSLSSVPYARVPGPASPLPAWLNDLMND